MPLDLHYRMAGEANAERAVVILHGVFGSSDNWMTLARQMAKEHGFLVYALDQRNHGQSPHSQEFTYEAMADDLQRFLTEKLDRKPCLIGHSMGGKTAMFLALRRPELLERLMVVDIAPRPYPVHHGSILKGLNALDLSALSSRGDADKALAEHEPDFGVRQFLLKNLYRKKEGGFAWRFNLPVLTERIDEVGRQAPKGAADGLPTRFLRGGKSQYVNADDEADIKARFPRASVQTVENAGHWIHAEAPNAFMERFLAFAQAPA